MSEPAAFLAAIAAAPHDDTPRLIFADWLEEQGQPERAEFIRVQCELAQHPRDGARRCFLEHRQAALLAAHETRWLPEVAWGRQATDWRFHRGFLDTVECPIDAIRDWLSVDVVQPMVRQIRWYHPNDDINELTALMRRLHRDDILQALTALDLRLLSDRQQRRVLRLVCDARLPRLRELRWDGAGTLDEEVAWLFRQADGMDLRALRLPMLTNYVPLAAIFASLILSPALHHLETLTINSRASFANPSFSEWFTHARFFRTLRRFHWPITAETLPPLLASLRESPLEDLALFGEFDPAELAYTPLLGQLRHFRLSLKQNAVPAEAWAELIQSPHWQSLRSLHLDGCVPPPEWFRVWLHHPALAHLEALTIDDPEGVLHESGLRLLVESPIFPQLNRLDWTSSADAPLQLGPLLERADESNLVHLRLSTVEYTGDSLPLLLRRGKNLLANLRSLTLTPSLEGTIPIARLAETPALIDLERLRVSAELTYTDAQALIAQHAWPRLTHWTIGSIEPEAASALAASAVLPRLREWRILQREGEYITWPLRPRWGDRIRFGYI